MDEQKRLIVTNVTIKESLICASALYHGKRLAEVSLEPVSDPPKDRAGALGTIYAGRVRDIVKNINAAFVEIAPGMPCYLNLKDVKSPVYVKKCGSPRLVPGDQLLVQVEKEAIKTKPPRVTTDLTFHGQYLVVSTQQEAIGASKKLPEERREQIKELLGKHRRTAFGVIARTAAENATVEELKDELQKLEEEALEMIARAPYQTCFSCLRRQEPFYLQMLHQLSGEALDEAVTDQKEIYHRLAEALEPGKVRFYEDSLLPLSKCYGLHQQIDNALREKVWLKSGGYLIIQPTEAMTVIDVNSGKSIAKKDPQEHYLKVNLEAAEEIAHQLRLRNISGIIMIDFIDLKDSMAQEALISRMKELTAGDPVPVQVVDLTKLNLMELTRKKVKRSLAEQVRAILFAKFKKNCFFS
ncbi:MAG: ribonuclease E/G [Lachnospiraceae bacterium]|nr:ribonuclease E/G [Lachnospiraceae bacterium]MCI9151943.1 ribonuclease E/G [Lachnospiraceae bacterium]